MRRVRLPARSSVDYSPGRADEVGGFVPKKEATRIGRLAGSLMVAQGGFSLLGIVDTMVIGRVSALDLGGVALGNTLSGFITLLGVGLAKAIEPVASQARGAGEEERCRAWLWQALYLSLLAVIPMWLLFSSAPLILGPIGIEPEMAHTASSYVYSRAPGVLFSNLFFTTWNYSAAIGRPRPIIIATMIGNVVNLILDWVFVFICGWGTMGLGLATSLCLMVMFALGIAPVLLGAERTFVRPNLGDIRRLFSLGWPISLQFAVGMTALMAVAITAGRIGKIGVASHQIAVSVMGLVWIGARGIAGATGARVGFYVGASSPGSARQTAFLGVVVSGLLGLSIGALLLLLPRELARLFAPTDLELVEMAARVLQVLAFFCVFECVQGAAGGALRATGDTRWPFYANLVAQWTIGLPVALYLGVAMGAGAPGLWWGMSAGVFAAASIQVARMARRLSTSVARI